ncbi:MAG: family 16 glycosylhydrolase [Bacteroidota bacterium]
MKKSLLLFLFCLLITSSVHSEKKYKGAEYRTKESFLYGRFEASIKSAGKEGMTTTMFTYFDGLPGDDWTSSKWNEIDIEIMGRYNNDVQFNTITHGQTNHVRHQYVNFDPALDYHIYAFEWTPDYVAWFIDGLEVYRQTGEHIQQLTRAQKFMFNIWNPNNESWVGVWREEILPAFGLYDWAAYYEYKPGEGNYGSENNFKFAWKDEFDFWDESRWDRATHTFGGNQCDFLPDNIVFKDGKMILCLTNNTDIGYTDKVGPSVISARTYATDKILVFFSEQVDKITAENKAKYVLTNGQITSASLMSDKRTVELAVSGINFSSTISLIILNGIKDLYDTPNGSASHARTVKVTQQITFPFKVNVGGDIYQDFVKDREFTTDTSEFGFMEKWGVFEETDPIANTDDDIIFQTNVFHITKYIVRVPNGKYSVQLLFSENQNTSAGTRVMDIYAQGNLVFDNLDVYSEAGLNSALIKSISNIEVYNGLIDIHFAAEVGATFLHGIIIDYIGPTGIKEEPKLQLNYQIDQNYPNPFNGSTKIKYSLLQPDEITFNVYDLLGRKIYSKYLGYVNAGLNQFTWNSQSDVGTKLSSGVYFYFIEGKQRSETKKLMLLN